MISIYIEIDYISIYYFHLIYSKYNSEFIQQIALKKYSKLRFNIARTSIWTSKNIEDIFFFKSETLSRIEKS